MVNHSVHFIGIPKRIQLWEIQSSVVRMFFTMNGEIQKYHGKFCSAPHLFLECFMAVLVVYSTMDGLYQDLTR